MVDVSCHMPRATSCWKSGISEQPAARTRRTTGNASGLTQAESGSRTAAARSTERYGLPSRSNAASSTAPWIALNLEDIDPKRPDGRPLILADAPAYALHYWNGERLLTHFDVAGPRHVLASYDSNVQPMIRDFLRERGTG